MNTCKKNPNGDHHLMMPEDQGNGLFLNACWYCHIRKNELKENS